MAHSRKGRRTEAMSWLKRVSTFKEPDSPDKFWGEQEKVVRAAEADAVVLLDPFFPADPFAH